MTDIALLILDAVEGVCAVAEGIEATDRQANRLTDRVAAIEIPLRKLIPKIGNELCSSEPLSQLLKTVNEVREFLCRYAGTEKVARALERKSNAETFTLLGTALSRGIRALHLSIAVDAWAQENVVDRLEDMENMIESMTDMLADMEGIFAGDHGRTWRNSESVIRAVQVSVRVRHAIIEKYHMLMRGMMWRDAVVSMSVDFHAKLGRCKRGLACRGPKNRVYSCLRFRKPRRLA